MNLSPLQELVVHHITIISGGLVLAILLWWFFVVAWLPVFKGRLQKEGAAALPIPSTLLMVVLTIGYFYWVNYSITFGKTYGVESTIIQERTEELRQQMEDYVPLAPSPPAETQEERLQRIIEQNRRENEEAKKRFQELPSTR